MTSLSSPLTLVPLSCLAIPGTHDSGTFRLFPDLGVGVDQPDWESVLASLTGDAVTSVIYNWSKTQNLTILEQLKAGIRYFDFRIASHPDNQEIRFIHGLYGEQVDSAFADVRRFLDATPKEVLILDFNHFYNMSQSDHEKLLNKISTEFFDVLVPQPGPPETLLQSMEELTLAKLWTTSCRVIVIYQKEAAYVVLGRSVWSKSHIESPWANTADKDALLNFLGDLYSSNKRPDNYNFYSWQGILTPSTETVLFNPLSTLEDKLGKPATERYTHWLLDKIPGQQGINICLADFCETDGFIQTVIGLNNKLLRHGHGLNM